MESDKTTNSECYCCKKQEEFYKQQIASMKGAMEVMAKNIVDLVERLHAAENLQNK